MWQVSQAWGWRASSTENRCRVWQASQEAIPKPPAAAAALHAFDHGHGLPVDGGHGVHRGPGKGVLAGLELFDLVGMAIDTGAGLGRGDQGATHVVLGPVHVAVALGAIHSALAVLARFPIGYNAGSDLLVALDTLGGGIGAGAEEPTHQADGD
jgi:hypothetical protein